jgi:Uncharacterised nucleotidyltransferase
MTTVPDRLRAIAAALAGGDAAALAPDAIETAIVQGVAPLVAAAAPALDAASRARLLDHVRASTIHGAALDEELRRLLPALARNGRAPLVIKGAHLAHTVYASPSLRPRGDTDLLILPGHRDEVIAALRAAGYSPAPLTSGTLILGQFLYQRMLGPGVVHYVDVHWRAAAPLVFGEAVDLTSMMAASVPIPGLGPAARGPAPHDALALACIHVVAHHWPDASLRWLNDLRLLSGALDDDGRARFAGAACAGRYREVAICALDRVRALFPSPALDAALGALGRTPAADEPSAALTRPCRRPHQDFLLDLKVAGWRRGPTLVREHLLPPPSYMRMAFAGTPLPLAYATRLVRAVGRLYRRGS